MTEGEICALARTLQAQGADCLVVDAEGAAVVGLPRGPQAGEPLSAWAPGWTLGGPPVRTLLGRWVQVERVVVAGRLTLALLIDRTCEHVADEARQIEARRRALVELAGATAREMNDPMTIVQGRLELLRAFGSDPEGVQRHCAIALEHANRLSGTLHNLRLVGSSGLAPVEPVSIADAAAEALDAAGVDPERVEMDLHPPDTRAVGQPAAVARVLAGVFRALGLGGRETIRVRVRCQDGRVVIELTTRGRRRPDLDALPLGLVTALLDAMGGTIRYSGSGLTLDLVDAGASEPALPVSGELLVVGEPRLAERIARLLAQDPVTVVPEGSAEVALRRLEGAGVVGAVSELLLPGRGGLAFAWEARRRRPDLPLEVVLVTHEAVSRLPGDVRALTAPLNRGRLVTALTPGAP